MDQVANQILAFTDNEGEIIKFSDFFQWEEWQRTQKRGALGKSAVEKAATKIPDDLAFEEAIRKGLALLAGGKS